MVAQSICESETAIPLERPLAEHQKEIQHLFLSYNIPGDIETLKYPSILLRLDAPQNIKHNIVLESPDLFSSSCSKPFKSHCQSKKLAYSTR